MARSDITTLIPLDRAAVILGISPMHFNMVTTAQEPELSSCDDIWFQFPYQKVGMAARDDLAMALRRAEDLVSEYLRFSPLPRWFASEEQIVRKPNDVAHINFASINSRGQYKSVNSDYGYVISGGVRGTTAIELASTITYSDADGDGYEELATVTVSTTVTEPQEIHVFFPGESGDEAWEVRPITVVISGGTATITFKKWQVPLPALWVAGPADDDPAVWRTIDGDVEANFLDTVDVYRVYNDISTQATFYHENSCASCSGTGCEVCNYVTAEGCLRVRNARLGILSYTPATWDSDEEEFVARSSSYPDPDKIHISYYAGWRSRGSRPLIEMDPLFERGIVYYAYASLDRRERCTNTANLWKYLSEDLSLVQPDRSHLIGAKDLQNPLGTTRAAVELWKLIEAYQLGG